MITKQKWESVKPIIINIPLDPTPQKRFKFVKKSGVRYKDKQQKKNESNLGMYLKEYVPKQPIEYPIDITITAYMRIPDSKPGWWKQAAADGDVKHTSLPDLDNMIKQIIDVMQDLQFFKNDKQICKIIALKAYSYQPSWRVSLLPLYQPQSAEEYKKMPNTMHQIREKESEV